jgi:NAD+ synthase
MSQPKKKKYIFAGRFQPFHNGHLEAIKWILAEIGEEVLIAIGSLQEYSTKDNPFLFKERKEMIEAALAKEGIKNYRIFALPDFRDDAVWAGKFLQLTGAKTEEAVVFSLNPWTKQCCEKMGMNVREQPSFFDGLSATAIREKIAKGEGCKELVPKEVFDYLKTIDGEERVKDLQTLPGIKIADFIKQKVKEAGAKGAMLGISGGIDSAIVAILAKKALGKNVIYLSMPPAKPNPFRKNILALERVLKIKVKEKIIGEIARTAVKGLPKGDKVACGNIYSRIRMILLYYFANLNNFLVLGTTNRSEMEIGYFTKYGDGGADIEPIADVYKTEIFEMAKRLGLPKEIIEAAPTAGLWPDQTDEQEIGLSYYQLDTVLKLLNLGFNYNQISFLTDFSKKELEKIQKRKKSNAHKLSLPPFCKLS